MHEYIILEEAMSLPVLPKEQRIQLNNVDEAFEEGWRQALENLAILPAADVVEVVRCRECVYWEPASPTKTSGNCNKAFEITAWATDFCSYGERKDGGQDDG